MGIRTAQRHGDSGSCRCTSERMDLACLKSGTKDGTAAHRGDAAASASVAHKVHGKLYRSRRTFLASQMQLCSSLVLEMASPRCMAVAWRSVDCGVVHGARMAWRMGSALQQ